jgi:hypothetical protein
MTVRNLSLQVYGDIDPTGGWRAWANPGERYHRYLNPGMSLLSIKFGEDWPSYFQTVVFSYNASVSRSTGFLPYYLFFYKRMARAYTHAVVQQERVAKLNHQRYERGHRSVVYAIGDHVLY